MRQQGDGVSDSHRRHQALSRSEGIYRFREAIERARMFADGPLPYFGIQYNGRGNTNRDDPWSRS